MSRGQGINAVYKALMDGSYPKTYKPTEEEEFNQALRQAKDNINEAAWRWELILWITATSPGEYLKLEQVPLPDLASARLHSLYNA